MCVWLCTWGGYGNPESFRQSRQDEQIQVKIGNLALIFEPPPYFQHSVKIPVFRPDRRQYNLYRSEWILVWCSCPRLHSRTSDLAMIGGTEVSIVHNFVTVAPMHFDRFFRHTEAAKYVLSRWNYSVEEPTLYTVHLGLPHWRQDEELQVKFGMQATLAIVTVGAVLFSSVVNTIR